MKTLPLQRVAVGIIWNETFDRILISQRHMTKDFGGLWEFPGGKVEPFEEDGFALTRELNEELGITINDFSPALKIKHDYDHKSVMLIVYNVYSYLGEPEGCEQQYIRWHSIDELKIEDFPKANIQIIEYIKNQMA